MQIPKQSESKILKKLDFYPKMAFLEVVLVKLGKNEISSR